MKLALFDLDHTLIPFDSGMAWTRFLVGMGALPAEAEARYLEHCHRYLAGTLDLREMHRASVAPLAVVPPAQLARWLVAFEQAMAPRIPIDMLALVRQHREAGHRCAIVTATTRFLAEPFARLFGGIDLVATEPAMQGGAPTGEIDGEPCYREHKVTHVERWLSTRVDAAAALRSVEASWFYSDSINDLPLLQAVAHPVAVRPDARLRAHAIEAGWPIVEATNPAQVRNATATSL